MLRALLILVLFLAPLSASSQDFEYQALLLPEGLSENANAIIRNEQVEVEIGAVDQMTIRIKRVVTVLNEYGNGVARTWEIYDEVTKIKEQEAIFYDQLGNQLKKVKKKDFVDRSLPGSNLITDNRLRYYEYIPRDYPYTVVYTSEVESATTIFVNPWDPVPGYYVSVENSSYQLKSEAGIPVRYQESNLDSLGVEISNSELELNYKLENLSAFKKEVLSPDLESFTPKVKVALDEFSLVGVEGIASDWADFGKWQYDHLLSGKSQLSEETIAKIENLTAAAESDLEKARLIYEYVQENTRYISVQLGIGGWEPMSAAEVDKLGYGDCKALTNYTRALLASQNITSYYAVVYGDEDRRNLDASFASMQGNHVILNIPNEGEDVWLECTSQTTPFNYLGDFTDDRNVLLVKPEGGEIVKTKSYGAEENLQLSSATILLDPQGSFSADFTRKSLGVPYGNIYPLMRQSEEDQQLYYKNSWGHLRNLELREMNFTNNRVDPEFIEKLALSGERYASKAGNRILLPLHFLNPSTHDLPNDSNRRLPIEIQRGRTYQESFEFILPTGFEPESIPESVSIENEFGSFSTRIEVVEKEGRKSILLQRDYVINEGIWPTTSYEKYRDFMNQINAISKQKAVLIKTS